jgi:plastocyanin
MRAQGKSWIYPQPATLSVALFCVCAGLAWAERSPVTARVEIVSKKSGVQTASTAAPMKDASGVVVWLSPADAASRRAAAAQPARPAPKLVQRNKAFEPHLVVVQAGSTIQFPNDDPFFHNVFSLFEGKRFDLGLYEAGTAKSVRFDRVGISFLFCNIHPEMSAVVVAVDTPFYAVSDRAGQVAIPAVPDGHYLMQVWYERGVQEDLKALARAVSITDSSRSLGTIEIPANPDFSLAHKNKYGQDYVPPPSGNPAYSRP